MKIALYIKNDDDELSTLLISKIGEYGFEFDQDNPDVVIFVGGDGTLLRAVHEFANKINNLSFVGINNGSLGYCCGYDIKEVDRLFNDLLNNNFEIKPHKLIKVSFNNETLYALNEVRIENPFHTLISDVFIDNEFFETFRGNGLNISSNFGSSAYNKSLGGSVVLLNSDIIQLTEIAPINNKIYSSFNSPLVIDGNKTITLRGDFSEVVVGYDHLTLRDSTINELLISLSELTVNILYKSEYSSIDQLRVNFIK
ncbi:MAG: NAD(+)/NADH kinase [Bacilli bacterium]|nr:NAD(+)/NADH kinase [Bacilli bacterium]